MIVVRQYGLGEPLDWGEDCENQLRAMNRLWNTLVEIEHGYREQVRALTDDDLNIALKNLELDQARQEKKEFSTQRKKLRSEARSKNIDTKFIDLEIKCLAETIRVLSGELKLLRAEVRKHLQEDLRCLNDKRYEEVKQARQQSGLWWCNYNAVCESYDRARKRAMKTGSALRFHRFDGSGRLKNQIQGGMTVAQLLTGKHAQVQIHANTGPVWRHEGRVGHSKGELVWTVYTSEEGRRTVRFPIYLHRPIPDDVILKEAVVSRRRLGLRYQWTVTFTCQAPDIEPAWSERRACCGIDIGWRKLPTGLRVATLIGTNSNVPEYLLLPSFMLEQWDYIEALQSTIDNEQNTMRNQLQAWDWVGAPEQLAARLKRLSTITRGGAGLMAVLAKEWREYPDYEPQRLTFLENWRRHNRRDCTERDNLRAKLIAHRREIYRIWAKEIAERYGVIGLEDFDLSSAARLEKEDGKETVLALSARRQRQIAACSQLRQWIELQAAKTGSQVICFKGPSTMTCHDCGKINRPRDRAMLEWHCEGCGISWDRDVNASYNLCNAAAGNMRTLQC